MSRAGGWTVRPVEPADAAHWERMRGELWPDESGGHGGEIADFLAGRCKLLDKVLIAVHGNGRPVGFAELSIRSHVDGCESLGVGYLEGWFVERESRRQGVGAALVAAAEDWARSRGCTEFASDVELDNQVSADAHAALGFEETGRGIFFRKAL